MATTVDFLRVKAERAQANAHNNLIVLRAKLTAAAQKLREMKAAAVTTPRSPDGRQDAARSPGSGTA